MNTLAILVMLAAPQAGDAQRERAVTADPPRVESIEVVGAKRTQPYVVLDLLGLEPETSLSPEALARAKRRLADLPAARSTRIVFTPSANRSSAVNVEAIVDERSMFGLGLKRWSGVGARALLKDEVQLDVSGLLGRGEVLSGAWRWSRNRPRVMFDFASPAPGRLPGVAGLELLWEHQTYALAPLPDGLRPVSREDRRRLGATLGDWGTSRFHWRAGTAFDRFVNRNYISLEGATDLRVMDDLVSLGLAGGTWTPLGDEPRFGAVDLSASWRLQRDDIPRWSGVVGTTMASGNAPLALWPGAGTGSGRGGPLRAHPLLEDGVLTSDVFGRRIAYFTVERQHQVYGGQFGRVALAGFMDIARAWQRLSAPGPSQTQFDIGTGLRLLTGEGGGNIRLDVAYGLRDQSWAVSAGWISTWPRR